MSDKKVLVKLVRSLIGQNDRVKATVKGLGLTFKIGSHQKLNDTPQVRGMINKVNHLIQWEAV